MTIFESLLKSAVRNFLTFINILPEIWITVGILLGVILLIVWKVKKRRKGMLFCSLALILCFSFFLIIGMYDAYLRPQSNRIDMTDEQLLKFGEYVVQNQDAQFLPNRGRPSSQSEKDDLTFVTKDLIYTLNSTLGYCSEIYPDEETARAKFDTSVKLNEDAEEAVLVSSEMCSVFARPVETEHHFFSWNAGVGHCTSICVYVYFENRIVIIDEMNTSPFGRPKFYRLAEKERFFDENYKPKRPFYLFDYE